MTYRIIDRRKGSFLEKHFKCFHLESTYNYSSVIFSHLNIICEFYCGKDTGEIISKIPNRNADANSVNVNIIRSCKKMTHFRVPWPEIPP